MPALSEWVTRADSAYYLWHDWVYTLARHCLCAGSRLTLFKERHEYEVVYFLMSGLHLVMDYDGPLIGQADSDEILRQQPGGGDARVFPGAHRVNFFTTMGSAHSRFDSGMVEEALELF